MEWSFRSLSLTSWLFTTISLGITAVITNIIYNIFFHPLSHIPGPLFAKASGIPSWYHALRGRRHIWLWQQFQIYGSRIRIAPNTVLFCDPAAYRDIYGMKSNVRRSDAYTAWRRNESEISTLNTVDVAEHAHKRKLLNLAFTEKSVRAASTFIVQHVKRWNELLVKDCGTDWSDPMDVSEKIDALVFDIMGDLCFGRSFDIKEPGDNPLKAVPHHIAEYTQVYYPITHSPFLKLLIWLKPRGLNELFEKLAPPPVKQYFQFLDNSVTDRIALQQAQATTPEDQRRQDMFYFLSEAQVPETGAPAYAEMELRGEAGLLIIAGSDTTATSLTGILFYLTSNLHRYQKLVDEIRNTFTSADEIVHGLKLLSCVYLKACIDEGMRLVPASPSEWQRQVLPGGLEIKGEYYPSGTIVGTSVWADSYNEDIYGDPKIFRPERWIVDDATGVTKEDVARIRANFHPFASGPGGCVGKNLAMAELMITLAQTLHRLDVRREPGSTFGGGSPELGWGARDPNQFQVKDAFIAIRKGPMLQFRKRPANNTLGTQG